ncbi:MAG: hypothetical protein ACI35R_06615 [Bacillus sp. (in: firmicutes)]
MKWLSVSEIEKITNVPNRTIRRYIERHNEHLQLRKNGNSYVIHERCVTVIVKIRDLYREGKTQAAINTMLSVATMAEPVKRGADIAAIIAESTNRLKIINGLYSWIKVLEEQRERDQAEIQELEKENNALKRDMEASVTIMAKQKEKVVASVAGPIMNIWKNIHHRFKRVSPTIWRKGGSLNSNKPPFSSQKRKL